MGIVERLRSAYSHRGDGLPTQFVNPDGPEAADLIERLKEYARHSNDCAFWFTRNGRCDCGLTALIKEIDGE